MKALRAALGLTQELVAGRANMSRVDISRIESGYNQATSHRARVGLANGFGLMLEDMERYLEGKIDVSAAVDLCIDKEKFRQLGIGRREVASRALAESVELRVAGHATAAPEPEAPVDLGWIMQNRPNLVSAMGEAAVLGKVDREANQAAIRLARLLVRDVGHATWTDILGALARPA